MSLAEKTLKLKLDAALAGKVASFWETQIAQHGEAKTTAFYKSLGLNHIEAKSIEWEGLTLSRQPTDIEKLCIKSIVSAQDAGKASVSAILLKLRSDLIDTALKQIKKLDAATYHELVLSVPDKFKSELRDQLGRVFKKGRSLVAAELSKQKQAAIDEEDDAELDDLVALTDSAVANDVQARVSAATARFALLGLAGAALWDAVSKEMAAGSVSYVDRAATAAAHRVVALGRYAEMRARADDIGRYTFSSILDQNTCVNCESHDGEEANTPDALPDAPLPECDGWGNCRCFIVAISV